MIQLEINRLIQFALNQELISQEDIEYVGNRIIDILQLSEFNYKPQEIDDPYPSHILEKILDDAAKRGVLAQDSVEYRDLLDTKIMDCLMPKPSEVIKTFNQLYDQNPQKATDYYYHLSRVSNYVRTSRVAKDENWQVTTPYGVLDMTINLSKPEKDPKVIAMAKQLPSSNYPKCLLCKENVGYAGTLNHPARQNHRIIPVDLQGEQWFLQYSPYVYYNEHCIILKSEHEPMKISRLTFERLLAFVQQYPHYFIGSNADLPIVGGSILTHDHFQGGAHAFAMERAEALRTFQVPGFTKVQIEFINWPLSVLRVKGSNPNDLTGLATQVLNHWREYSDESLGILAHTDGVPHQTITPIARYKNGQYELDLVLRNNRVSEIHPDGIFHAHAKFHHLKKENIGLIEVMGLAVLPGRLKGELEVIKTALLQRNPAKLKDAGLEKHESWLKELFNRYETVSDLEIDSIIKREVGLKFAEILECCGVYKLNPEGLSGVERFMDSLTKKMVKV